MDPNLLHPETLTQNTQAETLPSSKPPNEIEETKKISKRVLLLLFLILLILVPSGIFLYSKFKPQSYKSVPYESTLQAPVSSPKPSAKAADPTANWKTYNDPSGFSIKYPPILHKVVRLFPYGSFTDFTDIPEASDQGGTLPPDYILYSHEGGIGGQGLIEIDKGFRITVYKEDQAAAPDTILNYRNGVVETEKISVNGYESYKGKESSSAGKYAGVSVNVGIIKDKSVYVMVSNTFPSDRKDYIDLFNQILSTFKFTDVNNSSSDLPVVQKEFPSPNGNYIVLDFEGTLGIKDKTGKIISSYIPANSEGIGLGTTIQGQYGIHFKNWINNDTFLVVVGNGAGEEYEFSVDAKTGLGDKSSLKRIK